MQKKGRDKMGVSDTVATLYLQLGIAGATLLILLVFIILLFRFVTKDNKRVDKLCDKIDLLVSSYSENTKMLNEVLVCNDKDQKSIVKLLTDINVSVLDTQRRIVRIDDRTYHCLGRHDKDKKDGERP
jgi:hypothetical protein